MKMEKLGKFLTKVLVFVLVLVTIIAMGFLETQIVISLSRMFDVQFILNLSFMQVFGIIGILGIVTYKHVKTEENKEFYEIAADVFSRAASKAVSFLFLWFIFWLISVVIF